MFLKCPRGHLFCSNHTEVWRDAGTDTRRGMLDTGHCGIVQWFTYSMTRPSNMSALICPFMCACTTMHAFVPSHKHLFIHLCTYLVAVNNLQGCMHSFLFTFIYSSVHLFSS